jgi:WD40 repeat protein
MCLFERIFSHYINQLQGKDDLKVLCKCGHGYLNPSLYEILEIIKTKRENDLAQIHDDNFGNTSIIVEACDCQNGNNKTLNLNQIKFSEYFCIDCLRFVCPNCKNKKTNNHFMHRVFKSKNLIKYIKTNIEMITNDLDCKDMENFEKKMNILSKKFKDVIDKNLNKTIRKLDDLVYSIKELRKKYIDEYKTQMENNIRTFKIIKLYYMIFYNEINIELKKPNEERNDIFKLKYINNISHEFVNFEIRHPKEFDEQLDNIKNIIEKIQSKDFIESEYTFKKIEKKYFLEEMVVAHKKFITSLTSIKNQIITGSTDFFLKIYENDSGLYVNKQIINFKPIRNIIALKNGKIFVSIYNTNDIFIFELNEKNEYYRSQSLTKHNKPISTLIELDDGKIVSISVDGNIVIWEQKNRQYNIKQEINLNIEVSIGISLDEFKFAFTGENGIIYIYKAENKIEGEEINKELVKKAEEKKIDILKEKLSITPIEFKEICKLEKQRGKVSCMCKLNNGYLASGGAELNKILDKNIYIWKPQNNNYILEQIIKNAHNSDINSIIMLRNGNLASSSKDRTIKIWGYTKIENDNNYIIKYILKEDLNHYGHGLYKLIQINDDRLVVTATDNNLIFWRNVEGII